LHNVIWPLKREREKRKGGGEKSLGSLHPSDPSTQEEVKAFLIFCSNKRGKRGGRGGGRKKGGEGLFPGFCSSSIHPLLSREKNQEYLCVLPTFSNRGRGKKGKKGKSPNRGLKKIPLSQSGQKEK